MPVLHLLAGPNGAGKSTYANRVLTPVTGLPFINADVIAKQRWPGAEVEHAYEAARMAEGQRRQLMSTRRSFITETVFSHVSKVALIADAVALDYLVHLHVLLVPVDTTVQRVAERVRRGEHDVPVHKIRERFDRLWALVADAIDLADEAEVLDNSSARNPFRVCATFESGRLVGDASWPTWVPEDLVR